MPQRFNILFWQISRQHCRRFCHGQTERVLHAEFSQCSRVCLRLLLYGLLLRYHLLPAWFSPTFLLLNPFICFIIDSIYRFFVVAVDVFYSINATLEEPELTAYRLRLNAPDV